MILDQKNSIKPNVNSLKLLLILNRNDKNKWCIFILVNDKN